MVSTTETPGAIYPSGDAVSKAKVQQWMNEVVAQVNSELAAVRAFGGKIFPDRTSAVTYGQANLPAALSRIVTIEDGALVIRAHHLSGDDPLFGAAPQWGVAVRVPGLIALRDAGIIPLTVIGGVANWPLAAMAPYFLPLANSVTNANFVSIIPTETNTAAVQMTIQGVAAASPIVRADGVSLAGGELIAGQCYILQRRGASWRIVAGWPGLSEISGVARDGVVLPLENIGGTGDAWTADILASFRALGVTSLGANTRIEYIPVAANTSANVTGTIGTSTYQIRDAAGAVLSVGALQIGHSYTLRRRGSVLRIIGGTAPPSELAAIRAEAAAGTSAEATLRVAADTAIRGDLRQRSVTLAKSVVAAGTMTPELRQQFLSDAAHIRLWPGAPATISADKLTSMSADGQLGLTFVASASPNIDLLADGIRINGGYLGWVGTSAPQYAGALILLDVTRNAAPTAGAGNIVSLDLDAGTATHLRYTSGGIQAVGPDGSILIAAPIGGYGVRQQVALLVDYQARSITLVSADGVSQTAALAGAAAPLNLNQVRFGASSLVTIHDAVIMLTTAGVPDLATWWQVFVPPVHVAAPVVAEISVCDGQSEALGNDDAVASRQHLAYLARDSVMMVTGLRTQGSGVALWLHGPGLGRYDTAVPGTGLVPAAAQGNTTMGFEMAVALALHRKRLGLPARRQITGFAGVAGQSVTEFDDDSPVVTGTQGDTIHRNWQYLLAEMQRLGGGAVQPGYLSINQGEADRNMAPGAWLAQAGEWMQDRFGVYQTTFGGYPRLAVFQAGHVANTSVSAWACKTDMLDLCELYGGIFLAPMHQFRVGPDGVHALWHDHFLAADTGAWVLAEIEAGRDMPLLRPQAQRDGNVITLRYDLRPDEQLRRLATKYPTPEPHWGYEVEGATVTDVQQIGACVHRLTCTAPPTAVRYALQQRNMTGQDWSGHRGEVATTLTAPSMHFPGETLTREAPGWRIAL